MKTQEIVRKTSIFILGTGMIVSGILYSCCNCNKTYPDPVIKYDHTDADGRIYIPVVNFSVYPNELFAEAPDLPPCGENTKSARTWVDIYDAANNARFYGFCALKKNEDLKDIWFKPNTRSGKVYIIINDRKCKRTYRSNTVEWGECLDSLPKPVIRFDHKDAAGRVYIPVVNWSDYTNSLFREAPELPPCGTTTNSSRTWVDIYNADNNTRVYGFCALGKNSDLQGIWYAPGTQKGNVYIVMTDRACKREVRSNVVSW
ncbi:MAG TPA: hypothetical protein VIH57_18340 [Bacteroidales bacterium]